MSSQSLLDPVIDTFRPVKFLPEKIDDEFKVLNNTMKDPDPDRWEEREKALKKIAGMALQHAVDDEEFGRQLRNIRTTLQMQVRKSSLCMPGYPNSPQIFKFIRRLRTFGPQSLEQPRLCALC
jgi:hypothetical protein